MQPSSQWLASHGELAGFAVLNGNTFREVLDGVAIRTIYYPLDLESLGKEQRATGGPVITKRTARWSKLALLTSGILALTGATLTPGYAAPGTTKIHVVNGWTRAVDVKIDKTTLPASVTPGAVLPAIDGKPGTEAAIEENGTTRGQLKIKTKASSEAYVVQHLLANPEADAVLTEFDVETTVKVPSGKGWVRFLNVAATSPLAFRLNKIQLFDNVANGDFPDGVPVTAGTYKLSIIRTGETKPICCPDELKVVGGKITLVISYGDPATNTMNVVVDRLDANKSASGLLRSVPTGTGGQAVGLAPSLEVNLAR